MAGGVGAAGAGPGGRESTWPLEIDVAQAAAAHPLLSALRGDELLQSVVLQLQNDLPSRWSLLLPAGDAWAGERGPDPPSLEVLRACVIVLEGDFAVKTLDGERGSFSDDLASITFTGSDGGRPAGSRRILGQQGVSFPVPSALGDGAQPRQVEVNCFFVGALAAGGEGKAPPSVVVGVPVPSSPPAQAAKSSTNFTAFVDKMRKTQAMPLVRSIKKFISDTSVDAEAVKSDAAKAAAFHAALPETVARFLQQTCCELERNPLWKRSSDEELAAAREGVEKYLLCKLHPHVFAACPEERAADQALDNKLQELSALPAAAFGVSEQYRDVADRPRWEEAVRELRAMNDFKSPFDKIICVANAVRILYFLIGAQSEPHDLLPSLIMLITRARPVRQYCNVLYVASYRTKGKLEAGEDAYYFTTLRTAVDWLQQCDPAALRRDGAAAVPRSPDVLGVPPPPAGAAPRHADPRDPGAELADFLGFPAASSGSAAASPVAAASAAPADPGADAAAAAEEMARMTLERVRAALVAAGEPTAGLPDAAAAPAAGDFPVAAIGALIAECRRLWRLEASLRSAAALPPLPGETP